MTAQPTVKAARTTLKESQKALKETRKAKQKDLKEAGILFNHNLKALRYNSMSDAELKIYMKIDLIESIDIDLKSKLAGYFAPYTNPEKVHAAALILVDDHIEKFWSNPFNTANNYKRRAISYSASRIGIQALFNTLDSETIKLITAEYLEDNRGNIKAELFKDINEFKFSSTLDTEEIVQYVQIYAKLVENPDMTIKIMKDVERIFEEYVIMHAEEHASDDRPNDVFELVDLLMDYSGEFEEKERIIVNGIYYVRRFIRFAVIEMLGRDMTTDEIITALQNLKLCYNKIDKENIDNNKAEEKINE